MLSAGALRPGPGPETGARNQLYARGRERHRPELEPSISGPTVTQPVEVKITAVNVMV